MTQNVEAGLQMSYNLCNLPMQITTVNGKTGKYTYFADGTKGKISFNKSDGGAGKLYDITDEEEAFKRQAYIGGVLFWKLDYDYYLKMIPILYPKVNPKNTHTNRTIGKDLSNDIYR